LPTELEAPKVLTKAGGTLFSRNKSGFSVSTYFQKPELEGKCLGFARAGDQYYLLEGTRSNHDRNSRKSFLNVGGKR
jgi:hypothetical protein